MVLSEEGAKDGGLGGGVSGLVSLLESDLVNKPGRVRSRPRAGYQHLRFQTDHITNKLALVPPVCAHLACPVHELYAFHPFVHRQFSLARKVVDVSNQACHDLSHPRCCLRSHGVDDMICEGWVEAGGTASAIGRHVEECTKGSEVLVKAFSDTLCFSECLQGTEWFMIKTSRGHDLLKASPSTATHARSCFPRSSHFGVAGPFSPASDRVAARLGVCVVAKLTPVVCLQLHHGLEFRQPELPRARRLDHIEPNSAGELRLCCDGLADYQQRIAAASSQATEIADLFLTTIASTSSRRHEPRTQSCGPQSVVVPQLNMK